MTNNVRDSKPFIKQCKFPLNECTITGRTYTALARAGLEKAGALFTATACLGQTMARRIYTAIECLELRPTNHSFNHCLLLMLDK